MVAFVVLIVFGLFRLSRIIMRSVVRRLEARHGSFGSDRMLITGFLFLLCGLLFLPAFTAVLALVDQHHLSGGMVLHLVLVALSIILFSIAEDMFRDFPAIHGGKDLWSVSAHFRRIAMPLMVFWLIGVLFLSPIFYSGLSLILAIFYLFALSCRKTREVERSDSGGPPSNKKD
ncbi:MAG: hypothetical protein AVO35_01490 [Candidatus Aegiribacteria sp. MLS_C]|nr:MAG: hypothetical protein AVO35_01490 [Candidatus Aegiribacteria sp. MLS_C]